MTEESEQNSDPLAPQIDPARQQLAEQLKPSIARRLEGQFQKSDFGGRDVVELVADVAARIASEELSAAVTLEESQICRRANFYPQSRRNLVRRKSQSNCLLIRTDRGRGAARKGKGVPAGKAVSWRLELC